MSVFRYACRDDAVLFLGLSESASDDLFEPVDKKHRIFGMRRREDGSRPALPDILSPPSARVAARRDRRVPSPSTLAEIHLSALEQMAPADGCRRRALERDARVPDRGAVLPAGRRRVGAACHGTGEAGDPR